MILGLVGDERAGALLVAFMRRIEQGEGTEDDLDTLLEVGRNMTGTTICVLSDSCAAPVASSIAKFRDEYMARIRREVPAGALTV